MRLRHRVKGVSVPCFTYCILRVKYPNWHEGWPVPAWRAGRWLNSGPPGQYMCRWVVTRLRCLLGGLWLYCAAIIHDSQIKFPYMICEMNRYKVLKKGPSWNWQRFSPTAGWRNSHAIRLIFFRRRSRLSFSRFWDKNPKDQSLTVAKLSFLTRKKSHTSVCFVYYE